MKNTTKIKPILYGAANMIFVSLIRQDDWSSILSMVLAFVVGAFVFQPFITFMSDNKKDTHYK